MNLFRNRTSDDRGASLVEYGLIVAVISLLSLSAVTLVGEKTEDTFTDVAESLDAPAGGGPIGTVPGGGADDSDGGSGGGSATTTTTTLPPATTTTTVAPTTTTTVAPTTTTTVAPTTTTTQPKAAPGSTTTPTASASDFTWWNNTSNGGNGEWRAAVTFGNDWIRHQYLKLEVTEIDDKGKKTTTIVNSFYVPAGGSATFSHWSNELSKSKGNLSGVLEVEVKVLSITTSDESWKPVTYPQDGSTVATVEAPPVR